MVQDRSKRGDVRGCRLGRLPDRADSAEAPGQGRRSRRGSGVPCLGGERLHHRPDTAGRRRDHHWIDSRASAHMTSPMKQRLRVVLLLLAALSALPSAAEKRPITEKDLFKFVWV